MLPTPSVERMRLGGLRTENLPLNSAEVSREGQTGGASHAPSVSGETHCLPDPKNNLEKLCTACGRADSKLLGRLKYKRRFQCKSEFSHTWLRPALASYSRSLMSSACECSIRPALQGRTCEVLTGESNEHPCKSEKRYTCNLYRYRYGNGIRCHSGGDIRERLSVSLVRRISCGRRIKGHTPNSEDSMSASMRRKLFGSKSIESKLVEKIDAKTQVLVRVK